MKCWVVGCVGCVILFLIGMLCCCSVRCIFIGWCVWMGGFLMIFFFCYG